MPRPQLVMPVKAGTQASRTMLPCVYIFASSRNGTLYTGVTSDLVRRVAQHKAGEIDGFTARYGIKLLVFFEMHETMVEAIERETRIKKWRRAWKLALIERDNSPWRDLYDEIAGCGSPGFPLSRE